MNDDCENHKARVMKYKIPYQVTPNYEMVKFVIGGSLLLTVKDAFLQFMPYFRYKIVIFAVI